MRKEYKSITEFEKDFFALSHTIEIVLFCSIETKFVSTKNYVLFERTTSYLNFSLSDIEEKALFEFATRMLIELEEIPNVLSPIFAAMPFELQTYAMWWAELYTKLIDAYKRSCLEKYKYNSGRYQEALGLFSKLSIKKSTLHEANERAIRSYIENKSKLASLAEAERLYQSIYNVYEEANKIINSGY